MAVSIQTIRQFDLFAGLTDAALTSLLSRAVLTSSHKTLSSSTRTRFVIRLPRDPLAMIDKGFQREGEGFVVRA
jgi:hypothetical protein